MTDALRKESTATGPGVADTASAAGAAGGAPGAAGAAPPSASVLAESVRTRAKAASLPATIESPDPRVKWRARNGVIERSTDAGDSWAADGAPPVSGPVIGSAASPVVCWLAAGDLLLRRAEDGRWASVARPSQDRVVGVTALSALAAIVRDAAGRTFQTADGGAAWHEVPR